MMTVGQPITILLGGPMASTIVSPMRHAGAFSIETVAEPSMTTPGPCGGMGHGMAQVWTLAPPAPAIVVMMPPIEAAADNLAASASALAVVAAATATGAPGVPAAATAAASAIRAAVSRV